MSTVCSVAFAKAELHVHLCVHSGEDEGQFACTARHAPDAKMFSKWSKPFLTVFSSDAGTNK